MIDSHCHLDHEPIISNLSEILVRSKNAGIEKLLTICTTETSFVNILKLIEKDSIIYGTYGIHPHETNNFFVSKNEIIKNVKLNKKIIGVGETGLDFYYNNSDKKSQLEAEKLNNILQPVHSSMFVESNPSPVKYASKLLDLCEDEVRLPLVKVTDETKEIIKKALQSAKLI